MYSSSPPWCPVLAQFGHSLCWHSPCRNIRPTLPMARGAAAGPAETLLSQKSPAGSSSWGRDTSDTETGTASLLPRAVQGAPHGPGPKDTAWLHHHGTASSEGCCSTQTHKNTFEKSGGDGGKEGQGISEIPGEIDPDLGEKNRHSSILRAGALLLNSAPRHAN